jgi:hypothetical protein
MVRRGKEGRRVRSAHSRISANLTSIIGLAAVAGRSSVSKLQWWIGVPGSKWARPPKRRGFSCGKTGAGGIANSGPWRVRRARQRERTSLRMESGGAGRGEGESAAFYRAPKRRQARARALPDRAGAKLSVAYLTTEIIII